MSNGTTHRICLSLKVNLQDEVRQLTIFKSKADEFELKHAEAQKNVEALLKDKEEYSSKISQLQDLIER